MIMLNLVDPLISSNSLNRMYFSYISFLDLGSKQEVAGTLGTIFSCFWDVKTLSVWTLIVGQAPLRLESPHRRSFSGKPGFERCS